MAESGPALLSRLGSRLTLVPDVDSVRILPLGTFLPEFGDLWLELEGPAGALRVPSPAATAAGWVRTVRPSSIEWEGVVPETGSRLRFSIRSPFTPGLREWRDAPIMVVAVESLARGSEDPTLAVSLVLGGAADSATLLSGGLQAQTEWDLGQTRPTRGALERGTASHLNPKGRTFPGDHVALSVRGALRLSPVQGWRAQRSGRLRLDVEPGKPVDAFALLSHFTDSEVMEVDGAAARFAYTVRWSDALSLERAARRSLARILDSDRRWVETIPSRDDATRRLLPLALQSFLANTWLLDVEGRGLRYTEWEGFPPLSLHGGRGLQHQPVLRAVRPRPAREPPPPLAAVPHRRSHRARLRPGALHRGGRLPHPHEGRGGRQLRPASCPPRELHRGSKPRRRAVRAAPPAGSPDGGIRHRRGRTPRRGSREPRSTMRPSR